MITLHLWVAILCAVLLILAAGIGGWFWGHASASRRWR